MKYLTSIIRKIKAFFIHIVKCRFYIYKRYFYITPFIYLDKNNNVVKDEITDKIKWLDEDYSEGQLSIDVYETDKKIYIKSTMAGVKPEDLNISLHNDMLTIKGRRDLSLPEEVNDNDSIYKECYWGSFSRTIILPTEINEDKIDATLEDGVLTITLIKLKKTDKIEVKVK
jgi:HSP20 family protein